jgi:FtsZ-binding cell division protein ZapB
MTDKETILQLQNKVHELNEHNQTLMHSVSVYQKQIDSLKADLQYYQELTSKIIRGK